MRGRFREQRCFYIYFGLSLFVENLSVPVLSGLIHQTVTCLLALIVLLYDKCYNTLWLR